MGDLIMRGLFFGSVRAGAARDGGDNVSHGAVAGSTFQALFRWCAEWLAMARIRWAALIVVVVALGFMSSYTCAQVPLPKPIPLPNPVRQIPHEMLPASVPDGFTVAAVGDLIIAQPQTAIHDPGFHYLESILRKADVSFGNLEESLIEPYQLKVWPAAENGGGNENGPATLAKDIRQMGFDLLSRSNNHSTDWGTRGMLATARLLDHVGIVHAGTGKSLAAARAPAFLTTPQGRIALVAMTSTHTGMEGAGRPLRGVAGRPGASVLRATEIHLVTAQQMGWLRQIYNTKPHAPRTQATGSTTTVDLFGTHYHEGKRDGLTYRMNPYDLDEILRNVRQGKEESNFEIVYIHAHDPGNWSETPADFLRKLAHDAIDAGADEFIASGPHRLRGIEIYKGKPIFYSLGNFFNEIGLLRYLDPDLMQPQHLDRATTTAWEYQQYHLSRAFDGPVWYQSVVAVTEFDAHGNARKITLYPVDIGYKRKPRAAVGVPRKAAPEMAKMILKRTQRLSKPFGTHIAIHHGIGVITVTGH